jgi:thiamine biosynthesis lipoprotein
VTAVTPLVTWRALGTTVAVLSSEPPELAEAAATVHRVLDEIDRACSRFRDDSELCRLNAAGGSPMRVSRLFVRATRCALRAARLTDGDLDPTIGSSIRAAGYDRDFATIRAGGPVRFRRAGGWRGIELDDAHSTVRLPPGVELDYGATAKALAADIAAAAAGRDATGGVLVSIGGDIATAGTPPPDGWPVRVAEDHSSPLDGPGQTVALRGGGLATSSTTVRRWKRGERELHHILDPASGRPAQECWRTVSVAAACCVDANIASTAAIVRGERAADWLESLGLPSRLVAIDGTVSFAAGWPEGEHSSL